MKVKGCILAMSLAFAGCVTSPFLSEDAAERLAAVDALADQRKLAGVALDYCTEPYQELPTGCQMDVRVRAVERLTDRDLLMAVASFSIVKATVRGQSCQVVLGEPNAELRKLALEKLTEGTYIPSVLGAKDPFAIQPLFSKALFGYYQIAGQLPATAKDAWFGVAKGKEKAVAKAFCDCLGSNVSTELCRQVFALLPASPSSETKESIKAAYKQIVVGASSVNAAVRALQLANVVPADAVAKDDIDAMCKKISSQVATIGEFTAFGSLVNGEVKKYLADPESLIKNAATQVVPKLNGMDDLAAFAEVLKSSSGPWIGQIGIEDAVRKCAASVNNIGGIKVFANQLASFNTVMLPNKTDIAGDAVIAVLNAVAEGKSVASAATTTTEEPQAKGRKTRKAKRENTAQPGKKETIEDFVKAVTEFQADLLSDKAIVAIFANKSLNDAYSRAIRSDGYREDMGNEIAGAAMKSGSFGDMLAAGFLMSAMGDKESPKFTKMYSHLVTVIRSPDSFIKAAKLAKIYYPRNMLVEEAEKSIDSVNYSKCLLAVFENFPESSWCVGKTLTSGEGFVSKNDEAALAILQPVFSTYAKTRNNMVVLRALRCFNNADEIESRLLGIDFDVLEKANCRIAYMAALNRVVDLYKKTNQLDKSAGVMGRVSAHLVGGLNTRCEYLRKPEFAFPRDVAPLMEAIGYDYPNLWAQIMLKATIPPYSCEFNKVVPVLSGSPDVLVDFLVNYQCMPYHRDEGKPFSNYKKECDYIPTYYYDCEWYWQTLCAASSLEVSAESRKKLNEKMRFVAINGLELDTRKKVCDAIVGANDKKIVIDAWDKATIDIAKNATALFNLSLNDTMTKLKREKEWNDNYANKRIRLRGKLIDITDVNRYGSKSKDEFRLVLDGGSDITDMTFANKMPAAGVDPSTDLKIKLAKKEVAQKKQLYESFKTEDMKKDLEKAEKELAKLVGTDKSAPIKIVLQYNIDLPEKYRDQVVELGKGTEVVFEAYPYPVYARSDSSDLEANVRRFTSWMREGRIVSGKE